MRASCTTIADAAYVLVCRIQSKECDVGQPTPFFEDMRKDLFNEKAQPTKRVSEGFTRGMHGLQLEFGDVL